MKFRKILRQHGCCARDRIKALAAELRLTALPDIYGAIAQAAAKRKDASYADFLEEVLRAERDARRVRAGEMSTRTGGFPAQKTLEAYDFALPPFATESGTVRRFAEGGAMPLLVAWRSDFPTSIP